MCTGNLSTWVLKGELQHDLQGAEIMSTQRKVRMLWPCRCTQNYALIPLECLILQHTVKTYGGVKVYLHTFLTFGARWRCVVSVTPPVALPQGIPGTHLIATGAAPDSVWMRWQRENIPAPAGNQTPIIQPIAQTQYWQDYPPLLYKL